MKFVKIYKRIEDTKLTLDKVVDTNITDNQFEEIADYFEDATDEQIKTFSFIEGTGTIEVFNHDELLEDCPLPDGTIVLEKEFSEGGEYIVVLGDTENDKIIMGVTL